MPVTCGFKVQRLTAKKPLDKSGYALSALLIHTRDKASYISHRHPCPYPLPHLIPLFF